MSLLQVSEREKEMPLGWSLDVATGIYYRWYVLDILQFSSFFRTWRSSQQLLAGWMASTELAAQRILVCVIFKLLVEFKAIFAYGPIW